MGLKSWIQTKLNPAQSTIALEQGLSEQGNKPYTITQAYDAIPVVRRGVDMLVDAAASLDYDVLGKVARMSAQAPGIRKEKLHTLLNYQPNLYQDISRFRRLLFLDLVLEGNCFIYFDGAYLYHLPAENVTIEADERTFVKAYVYSGTTTFKPTEVIHVADNSSLSIYRGTSRLLSVLDTLATRQKMTEFQSTFFSNGAVPGLVLKSPNVLGDKVKKRLIETWIREYSPTRGGKRPLVLDGGLELDRLAQVNFRELDFEASIAEKDTQILTALGVPPILLEGGNNANIQPNLRLFYLETVLPLCNKLSAAIEHYFAYNIQAEPNKVSSLAPDLRDSSAYFTTLVNGGILTPNEARAELRYEPVSGGDEVRIPANIAGSAANPSQGGRPSEEDQ